MNGFVVADGAGSVLVLGPAGVADVAADESGQFVVWVANRDQGTVTPPIDL
jgi:hypothetical protein